MLRTLLVVVMSVAACGGADASPAANGDAGQPVEAQASTDARAALLVEKGCPQCHSISALGITSPTEVGPDLTHAATDVPARFGTSLEEFLANPTGTMQIVLSAQITLSPVERDSIVQILLALAETP